jgi:hypothetical protein
LTSCTLALIPDVDILLICFGVKNLLIKFEFLSI